MSGSATLTDALPILMIYGETATGKTELAVELAEKLGGEIVNADSMQVYRGMDIGTAKPTAEQRRRARFHLIDVADPLQTYSAARFKEAADAAIRDIAARGRVPIVAGGTGLYLKILCHGLIDGPALDREFRDRLKAEEAALPGSLHRRLAAIDPDKAEQIPPRDTLRVIRALEVHRATGDRLSTLQREHHFGEQPYAPFKAGLLLDREELRRLIEKRVRVMVDAGFVDEVRGLVERGATVETPAMGAVGFGEMMAHLRGERTLEQAIEDTIRGTIRLTKKQRTWFRADREIRWYPWPASRDALWREVSDWAGARFPSPPTSLPSDGRKVASEGSRGEGREAAS